MNDQHLFKQRLKETRKMRELSQLHLAKKAGLSATLITHFETGQRKPSFINLIKIADGLEVSVDYLMGRTESISGIPLLESKIFRDYEALSNYDRKVVRDFMAMLAKRKHKDDSNE